MTYAIPRRDEGRQLRSTARRATGLGLIGRYGLGLPALVIWMATAIVAVAGLAYWDEQREARAVLNDFESDQMGLAEALARTLTARLALIERRGVDDADLVGRLLPSLHFIERPGDTRVLLKPPGRADLLATDGSVYHPATLLQAIHDGLRAVRLSHSDASELGLPRRLALAGLAHADAGKLGTWHVVVIASAQNERDRDAHARWRILLGVGVVAGLVLAFGSFAVRMKTKELELRHALALNAVRTEHDARLVQADKLATMGALATGIAHEVSTPLGIIVARAERILAKTADSDHLRASAQVIAEQSARINDVIRGFLELARGGMPTLEKTAPHALADEAINLVSHRFTEAGVHLEAHVDVAAPAVACERKLFVQVLVNLLLNACDACLHGGRVELAIRANGEHVAFIVSDDGIGISDEAAARAAEPFFTTKSDGTGLGLAIATEIVKHHQGTFALRPRSIRGGTEAVVELPAVPHAESQEPA